VAGSQDEQNNTNEVAVPLRLERRWYILARLLKDGRVSTAELANELGVTARTIRRDIADIFPALLYDIKASEYVIERGGARLEMKKKRYYDFNMRCNVSEKQAIARRIVLGNDEGDPLIHENEGVYIGLGSTTTYLARAMRGSPYVILTNSIGVINELADSEEATLSCSGGELSSHLGGFIGDEAAEVIGKFNASKVVIGTSGISLETGDLTFHDRKQRSVLDAAININTCKTLIIAADAGKFGHIDPWVFANMKDLAKRRKVVIVTAGKGAEEHRTQFEAYREKLQQPNQLELIVAPLDSS